MDVVGICYFELWYIPHENEAKRSLPILCFITQGANCSSEEMTCWYKTVNYKIYDKLKASKKEVSPIKYFAIVIGIGKIVTKLKLCIRKVTWIECTLRNRRTIPCT